MLNGFFQIKKISDLTRLCVLPVMILSIFLSFYLCVDMEKIQDKSQELVKNAIPHVLSTQQSAINLVQLKRNIEIMITAPDLARARQAYVDTRALVNEYDVYNSVELSERCQNVLVEVNRLWKLRLQIDELRFSANSSLHFMDALMYLIYQNEPALFPEFDNIRSNYINLYQGTELLPNVYSDHEYYYELMRARLISGDSSTPVLGDHGPMSRPDSERSVINQGELSAASSADSTESVVSTESDAAKSAASAEDAVLADATVADNDVADNAAESTPEDPSPSVAVTTVEQSVSPAVTPDGALFTPIAAGAANADKPSHDEIVAAALASAKSVEKRVVDSFSGASRLFPTSMAAKAQAADGDTLEETAEAALTSGQDHLSFGSHAQHFDANNKEAAEQTTDIGSARTFADNKLDEGQQWRLLRMYHQELDRFGPLWELFVKLHHAFIRDSQQVLHEIDEMSLSYTSGETNMLYRDLSEISYIAAETMPMVMVTIGFSIAGFWLVLFLINRFIIVPLKNIARILIKFRHTKSIDKDVYQRFATQEHLIELREVIDVLPQIFADFSRMSQDSTVLQQRYDALLNHSKYDALTKVFNRGSLNELIKEAGTNTPANFAILMVDIDHFKNLNDTMGHQRGDEVLFAVAQTLQHNLSKRDKVFRYGGEEFCIILNEISAINAFKVASRLCDTIRNLKLINEGVPSKTVTVSVGLSLVTSCVGQFRIEELISQADKALYLAKRNGRNRVVVCPRSLVLPNESGSAGVFADEQPQLQPKEAEATKTSSKAATHVAKLAAAVKANAALATSVSDAALAASALAAPVAPAPATEETETSEPVAPLQGSGRAPSLDAVAAEASYLENVRSSFDHVPPAPDAVAAVVAASQKEVRTPEAKADDAASSVAATSQDSLTDSAVTAAAYTDTAATQEAVTKDDGASVSTASAAAELSSSEQITATTEAHTSDPATTATSKSQEQSATAEDVGAQSATVTTAAAPVSMPLTAPQEQALPVAEITLPAMGPTAATTTTSSTSEVSGIMRTGMPLEANNGEQVTPLAMVSIGHQSNGEREVSVINGKLTETGESTELEFGAQASSSTAAQSKTPASLAPSESAGAGAVIDEEAEPHLDDIATLGHRGRALFKWQRFKDQLRRENKHHKRQETYLRNDPLQTETEEQAHEVIARARAKALLHLKTEAEARQQQHQEVVSQENEVIEEGDGGLAVYFRSDKQSDNDDSDDAASAYDRAYAEYEANNAAALAAAADAEAASADTVAVATDAATADAEATAADAKAATADAKAATADSDANATDAEAAASAAEATAEATAKEDAAAEYEQDDDYYTASNATCLLAGAFDAELQDQEELAKKREQARAKAKAQKEEKQRRDAATERLGAAIYGASASEVAALSAQRQQAQQQYEANVQPVAAGAPSSAIESQTSSPLMLMEKQRQQDTAAAFGLDEEGQNVKPLLDEDLINTLIAANTDGGLIEDVLQTHGGKLVNPEFNAPASLFCIDMFFPHKRRHIRNSEGKIIGYSANVHGSKGKALLEAEGLGQAGANYFLADYNHPESKEHEAILEGRVSSQVMQNLAAKGAEDTATADAVDAAEAEATSADATADDALSAEEKSVADMNLIEAGKAFSQKLRDLYELFSGRGDELHIEEELERSVEQHLEHEASGGHRFMQQFTQNMHHGEDVLAAETAAANATAESAQDAAPHAVSDAAPATSSTVATATAATALPQAKLATGPKVVKTGIATMEMVPEPAVSVLNYGFEAAGKVNLAEEPYAATTLKSAAHP